MMSWLRSTFVAVLALTLAFSAFAAEDTDVIFPSGGTKPGAPATAAGDSLNSVSLVVGLLLAAAGGWFVWRNRRRIPPGREVRALARIGIAGLEPGERATLPLRRCSGCVAHPVTVGRGRGTGRPPRSFAFTRE